MKKQYKKPECEDMIAKEPVVEYHAQGNVQSLSNERNDYLPEELLVNAINHAETIRKQKRMIPNDEVYDILATKLGWK